MKKKKQRKIQNKIISLLFLLYLHKTTIDLTSGQPLSYCPWFDFSNPVFSKSPSEIDDYLFDKFNISDEIRQHIEELLPDYYGIRKG